MATNYAKWCAKQLKNQTSVSANIYSQREFDLTMEIAELLGIKEKSSSSLLRRAKDLLAKKIKEYNKKNHPR